MLAQHKRLVGHRQIGHHAVRRVGAHVAGQVGQEAEDDFRQQVLVIDVNTRLIDKAVELGRHRALRGYDDLPTSNLSVDG